MNKSKFQRGDRVIIRKKPYEGAIGTVVTTISSRSRLQYLVKIDSIEGQAPLFYSYELDKYEPVSEEPEKPDSKKPETKYAVGDHVVLTEQTRQFLSEHGVSIPPCINHFIITGVGVPLEDGAHGYLLNAIDEWGFDEDEIEPYNENADLRDQWNLICDEYLKAFCERHGYEYDPEAWVGGDRGGVAEVCDMFVGMDDMRYDVDNNVEESRFANWYWRSLEIYELTDGKDHYMNYSSFCKGAPDPWTDEKIAQIKEGKRRIDDARRELEQEIENVKKNRLF